MREGKFVEDVLRLILGNVRLPDMMRGDLIAQRNANFLGGTQFLALYRHYGAKVFDRIVTEILDHTERDMVERLKHVRSGQYAFEVYLDDAGTHTDTIKIAVDIEIPDHEASLAFARSSNQKDEESKN